MESTNPSNSILFSSRSNEHSPKHPSFSLTPTNTTDQSKSNEREEHWHWLRFFVVVFSCRSYPYLSISSNGANSTIVPTTPVDPSVTNLGLLSSSSNENSAEKFKKSTSMRFAKLIEHPSNSRAIPSNVFSFLISDLSFLLVNYLTFDGKVDCCSHHRLCLLLLLQSFLWLILRFESSSISIDISRCSLTISMWERLEKSFRIERCVIERGISLDFFSCWQVSIWNTASAFSNSSPMVELSKVSRGKKKRRRHNVFLSWYLYLSFSRWNDVASNK